MRHLLKIFNVSTKLGEWTLLQNKKPINAQSRKLHVSAVELLGR